MSKGKGMLRFLTALLITTPAIAAETTLPITVNLVKCGETNDDIEYYCKNVDERCCVLIELSEGEDND